MVDIPGRPVLAAAAVVACSVAAMVGPAAPSAQAGTGLQRYHITADYLPDSLPQMYSAVMAMISANGG